MSPAPLILLGWLTAQAPVTPPFSDIITVDRVRLDDKTARLATHALAGELHLATRKPKTLAAKLRPRLLQTPCAEVIAEHRRVRLSCTTRKLRAQIVRKGGRRFLEITTLRAVPTASGAAALPLFPLDPVEFGLGGPCPGDTPAAAGECALQRGTLTEAARRLKEALEGPNASYAALRLGDLALRVGDVASARGWYLRVGQAGPFGRLATARACELEGSCFLPLDGRTRRFSPYDLGGTSGALREELALRAARSLAFEGRPADGVRLLLEEDLAPCARKPELCFAIEREALKLEQPHIEGLTLYLVSEDPRQRDTVVEHAALAAEQAARLGAPGFSASLLAATSDLVRAHALEDHLLRNAELYLDAGDRARAQAVLSFAKQHVSRRRQAARWQAVRARLSASTAPASASAPADEVAVQVQRPSEELEGARAAMERARSLRQGGTSP